MASGNFVAYFRVSTARQGASGLGLDAQRQAVMSYLNGGNWSLVAEFTEVESGKRDDRPELAKAIRECRLRGAVLVIAKLDRLARNVRFVAELMDSGVEFVACDFPQANRLTVHILAAVAEHERTMIASRTKAALAAAKARGVKLGNPSNLRNQEAGSVKGNAVKAAKADKRAADLAPVIADIQAGGAGSLRAIAAELNRRGIRTARGGEWSAVQVARIMGR